jgi:YggT family protein
MISVIAGLIDYAARILMILIVVDSVLSFFVSPFNSVRIFLDRIVNPMLAPIRRVIPPMGGIDLSPIILLIGIQIIQSLLLTLLNSFR